MSSCSCGGRGFGIYSAHFGPHTIQFKISRWSRFTTPSINRNNNSIFNFGMRFDFSLFAFQLDLCKSKSPSNMVKLVWLLIIIIETQSVRCRCVCGRACVQWACNQFSIWIEECSESKNRIDGGWTVDNVRWSSVRCIPPEWIDQNASNRKRIDVTVTTAR